MKYAALIANQLFISVTKDKYPIELSIVLLNYTSLNQLMEFNLQL